MAIAESPRSTARGSKASGDVSNVAASAPLASISQTSVRLPDRAPRWASAAATDVLPTPPLPVTKRSRRSSRPPASDIRTASHDAQRRPASRRAVPADASATEADTTITVVRAELDVGDLRRRDADPPAPLVRQPHHVDRAGQG